MKDELLGLHSCIYYYTRYGYAISTFRGKTNILWRFWIFQGRWTLRNSLFTPLVKFPIWICVNHVEIEWPLPKSMCLSPMNLVSCVLFFFFLWMEVTWALLFIFAPLLLFVWGGGGGGGGLFLLLFFFCLLWVDHACACYLAWKWCFFYVAHYQSPHGQMDTGILSMKREGETQKDNNNENLWPVVMN